MIRNSLRSLGVALCLGATSLMANNKALVEFPAFSASEGGTVVEVNLQPGLLSIASRLASCKEPEAAELLRNLKHVRVNVVDLDASNREATLAKIRQVRESLTGKGWQQVVKVVEKKGDDVNIHVMVRGDESIEGLVVTVIDGGKQAVFVNIVGDIRPEQLNQLAEHLDLPGLKKLKHS